MITNLITMYNLVQMLSKKEDSTNEAFFYLVVIHFEMQTSFNFTRYFKANMNRSESG